MGEIYAKIGAILTDADAIGKDRTNTQQGFKFRGIDDVYNSLHPLLAKHQVFSTTEVLEERTEERTTKSGSALIYRILRVRFTFYTTDGSSVQCVIIGEGMDSGDKASNKAMAIAHKYALLQLLAIPTEDAKDPDSESHDIVPKPAVSMATPKPAPFTDDIPWTEEEHKAAAEKKKEKDKLAARAKELCTRLGKTNDVKRGLWKANNGDLVAIVKELEEEEATKGVGAAI